MDVPVWVQPYHHVCWQLSEPLSCQRDSERAHPTLWHNLAHEVVVWVHHITHKLSAVTNYPFFSLFPRFYHVYMSLRSLYDTPYDSRHALRILPHFISLRYKTYSPSFCLTIRAYLRSSDLITSTHVTAFKRPFDACFGTSPAYQISPLS